MERLLPMTSKLGFGVGQIAEGVKATIFNTFVLFYYNQILGLPAIQTAFVLGAATLFDGITDPVAGYLSDRTRSRFGRRHPWMMFSAVPLGATLVVLLCPPVGMSNIFYTGWLLMCPSAFISLLHCITFPTSPWAPKWPGIIMIALAFFPTALFGEQWAVLDFTSSP